MLQILFSEGFQATFCCRFPASPAPWKTIGPSPRGVEDRQGGVGTLGRDSDRSLEGSLRPEGLASPREGERARGRDSMLVGTPTGNGESGSAARWGCWAATRRFPKCADPSPYCYTCITPLCLGSYCTGLEFTPCRPELSLSPAWLLTHTVHGEQRHAAAVPRRRCGAQVRGAEASCCPLRRPLARSGLCRGGPVHTTRLPPCSPTLHQV